jgi:hypothetical protein
MKEPANHAGSFYPTYMPWAKMRAFLPKAYLLLVEENAAE